MQYVSNTSEFNRTAQSFEDLVREQHLQKSCFTY